MSLKSSIVIVNEYTIKTGSKTGSRGGSPGSYVLEYMARKGATEPITPARIHDWIAIFRSIWLEKMQQKRVIQYRR